MADFLTRFALAGVTNYVAWGVAESGWEANGLAAYAYFWDDANSNGVRDAEEPCVTQRLALNGHDNTLTNTLSTLPFDRDRDGILDWWEHLHSDAGLSSTNSADAWLDPDGDGLLNLHEYWAGTEPLAPDGSNTLLSVCARSIDGMINGVVPSNAVFRFVDYLANGSNGVFVANSNFWARNLDLSCVSVWHGDEHPETKTATAITRRHVVMAKHWWAWNSRLYTFCDTNGVLHIRNIIAALQISDDLLLGRLDSPLPDSIRLPKILPIGYANYIGDGKHLPALCVNQEKAATVLEIADLNCEVTDSGGTHHSKYASNLPDNYVSTQRHDIRAVTSGGNSSSPVFLVAGDDLIFLFSKHLGSKDELTWCWFYGPMITHHVASVQSTINAWEGENQGLYQVEMLDLSVFNGIVNQ